MIRTSRPGLDSLTKGLLRDTPGLIALLVLTNGCSVLINILLIRKGGTALSDGVFHTLAVFSIALYVAYLGIPQAMTQWIARTRSGSGDPEPGDLVRSGFGALAITGSLACVGTWAYSEAVPSGVLLGANLLPISIWLLSVVVLKAVSGSLQGFGKVGLAMVYEQSLEVLRLAVLAALLYAGQGARAILWGWALVSFAYAGVGIVLLRKQMRSMAAERRPEAGTDPRSSAAKPGSTRFANMPRFFSLGFFLFLPTIGNFAAIGAITMALAATDLPGQVTGFAISTQIPGLLILAAFPLGALLLPAFARRAAEGGKGLAKSAGEILIVTSALQLALAALLALTCPWIIRLLFTDAHLDAVVRVRWLCAAYALEAMKHAIDPVLISLGRSKGLASLEGMRILAAACLAAPVAQGWGLEGCVVLLAGTITGAFLGRLALLLSAFRKGAETSVLD